MGAGESRSALAPWQEAEGVDYPDDIAARIKALSGTATPFLSANPHYWLEFNIADHTPRLQGALTYDANIAKWYPKLVPRKVDETAFWRNYFSHVASIVTEGQAQLPSGAEYLTPLQIDTAIPSSGSTVAFGEYQLQRPAAVHSTLSPPALFPTASAAPLGSTSRVSGKSTMRGLAVSMSSASSHSHAHALPELQMKLVPPVAAIPAARLASLPNVRWGVVGAGTCVRTLVLPVLLSNPGSQVVAITSRDASRSSAIAAEFGIPRVHDNLTELLSDGAVDAVYVATPPGSHAAIAIEVAKARKPCLIEKALARTGEECRLIGDEFSRSAVPLFVHQHKRFLPKFQATQQLLQSSYIGRLLSVNYQFSNHLAVALQEAVAAGGAQTWRTDAKEAGGGLVMEFGSELVDVLDYLLGPLTHVQGDAFCALPGNSAAPLENVLSMSFRTDNEQVLGTASFNFVSAVSQDMLTFIGTAGQVNVSVFGADAPILRRADSSVQAALPATAVSVKPQSAFLSHVVSEIRLWHAKQLPASGTLAAVAGSSATRTGAVLDALLRDYYRNRSDAFWLRPETWKASQAAVPSKVA